MAHKNVSFFIPKTMMTTGEKMKENSAAPKTPANNTADGAKQSKKDKAMEKVKNTKIETVFKIQMAI